MRFATSRLTTSRSLWWQQRLVRLQGAVALDGEVAACQRRATDEGGGHLQVQAAGAEQCRLHDNAGQPLVDRDVRRVDEDG